MLSPATPRTCCLYLRVSTTNGTQDLENQRPDLVRLARARGFEIVEVYEERGSAVKHRREFERMKVAAHAAKFGAIIVWSLDRLGRSMVGNLRTVIEFDRIGVQVISVKEPWMDTSGPVRDLLLAIFSWVAEQERRRISERTKAGLEKARKKGRLGRPRVHVDLPRALELTRNQGLSIRAAATKLGIGASTLHRALKAHEELAEMTSGGRPKEDQPDGSHQSRG